MSSDPALQVQLRDMMNKARRSLKAASRHINDGDFDFAASRAYYAAFYAMEAALLAEGVTCSTHSGAIAAFSKRFIKTGVFPSEFGAVATRLFRERQTGDYEFDVSVTAQDADQDVSAAATFLEAVERHLPDAAVSP